MTAHSMAVGVPRESTLEEGSQLQAFQEKKEKPHGLSCARLGNLTVILLMPYIICKLKAYSDSRDINPICQWKSVKEF